MCLIYLVAGLFYFYILVSAAGLTTSDFAISQCSISSLPRPLPRLEDISIEEIHALFENGSLASFDLVHASPFPAKF